MHSDYTRPGVEPWWETEEPLKMEDAVIDLPLPSEFNAGETGLLEYFEKAVE